MTKTKRRLTTILFADVHGYSRMMEVDEAGTMAALRRSREAMGSLVARHDGRIVNTWGDAAIAEFGSVVEAVQCAVEIQQELSGEAAGREGAPLRYRIGINLGDVMVEGDDIYGDGVNIAARLQELAEPGGVLISGSVYEQVRNKLPVGFDCLGEQQVKNVATPVVSYRVMLPGAGASSPAVAPRLPRERSSIDAPGAAAGRRPGGAGRGSLHRSSIAMLGVCALLVFINLASNPRTIWFHWPVVPMLIVVLARELSRHRPEGTR